MYAYVILAAFVFALTYTQPVVSEGSCVLLPGNGSLIPKDSSSTKIFQVDLDIDMTDNDNETNSDFFSFKPTRWYLVRGTRSHRLLLLIYYYYGFLNSLLAISTSSMKADIAQSPADCLKQKNEADRNQLIRSWLANASKISVDTSADKIDEVCSMFIRKRAGFGKLQFHCCRVDDIFSCFDVEEDGWVWTLRIFIILVTVFLFFYFPNFIPRKYKRKIFTLVPKSETHLRIVKTRNPERYIVKGKQVYKAMFSQMSKLADTLLLMDEDVVETTKIKSVDLLVKRNEILSVNDDSVNFFQLFYDYILRCKIRNVEPIRRCCYSPICGPCGKSCNWWVLLDLIKTIAFFLIIALPAMPLFYSLSANNLEYMELDFKINQNGLLPSTRFRIGEYAGKCIVALLTLCYVVNIFIVVLSNSLHEELQKLLDDTVTELNSKRQPVTTFLSDKLLSPFKKCCILYIPVFIIGVLLSPLIVILYLLLTSPVAKLIFRQFSRFCCFKKFRYKGYTNPTLCGPKVTFLLFLTSLGVFAVLTIGFNFLMHLICILLVNLLINIGTFLSGVSLVFLLVVYVRDSINRLKSKYESYLSTLLGEVLAFNQDDVASNAIGPDFNPCNTAFQYGPDDFSPSTGEVTESGDEKKPEIKWDIHEGYLRMHSNRTVLFLDHLDIPYIPTKFFWKMTSIQCSGGPGTLKSSVIHTIKEIGKIVLFLTFLFILIFAYGDTVYVSPTSKLFATIATGLIPLSLRSFFFKKSAGSALDTSTKRFQYLFKQNILSFMKRWPVSDMDLSRSLNPSESGNTLSDATNNPGSLKPEVNEAFVPDDQDTLETEKKSDVNTESESKEINSDSSDLKSAVETLGADVNANKTHDVSVDELDIEMEPRVSSTNELKVDLLFDLSEFGLEELDTCGCCRSNKGFGTV